MKPIDQVSGDVVDAAIQIHRDLGPGLLESVYEIVLAGSLARSGYRVARQTAVDINYGRSNPSKNWGRHMPSSC